MPTAITNPSDPGVVTILYSFKLRSGLCHEFEVRLHRPDLRLVPAPRKAALPEWTRLSHHQCTHCPLRPDSSPHCPVAVALIEVIERFGNSLSFEEAEICIHTAQREYRKVLPLQYGISSLMGLLMVTSGCPVMEPLRPMAMTHLPFASVEETLYRALGMYLFAQSLRSRRGLEPDWELRHLTRLYEEIAKLNQCFSQRLLTINTQDANLNALVNLDCFASFTSISVEDGSFKDFEPLFGAYLEEPSGSGAA